MQNVSSLTLKSDDAHYFKDDAHHLSQSQYCLKFQKSSISCEAQGNLLTVATDNI